MTSEPTIVFAPLLEPDVRAIADELEMGLVTEAAAGEEGAGP